MMSVNYGLFQIEYQNLSDYIRKRGIESLCAEEFRKLDNNCSRVHYLLDLHQKITSHVSTAVSKTCKNLKTAESLKTEGNKFFQKQEHYKALEKYNKAILLAPTCDSKGLLGVLFANRSAVLFSMSKYSQCLVNIELALAHGYPQDTKYKLLIRRAKCYQFTASEKEFQDSLDAATSSLASANLSNKVCANWSEELSKLSHAPLKSDDACDESLKQVNQEFPSLSANAGVAENKEFGRYIHAERDIEAGSTVLVEMPYCSVTMPMYFLTHCSHCQARADTTPYPCVGCADVIYCSQDCQQKSWQQYHQYECDYILKLRDVNVNMGHLAVRTALKAGYDLLKGISNGCMKITAKHPYESQDYLNVFNLEGHESERSSKDLFWRAYACVILAHICDTVTWSNGADDAKLVLATFSLHHMQLMPCNAHEISELVYDVKHPYKSETIEIGGGIYPTLSLFNHSCDPVVVRTFSRGNTCVMKALSPIGKDEQVYDNYGVLYAVHDQAERQRKVQGQYYFQCLCTPCTQMWPEYPKLSYDEEPMYKCVSCQTFITSADEMLCDNCDASFDKVTVDNQLAKAKQTLDKHLSSLFCENLSLMTRSSLKDKVRTFETYSQLVNTLVFRPYKSLNDCQEALKHLYGLLGNCTTVN